MPRLRWLTPGFPALSLLPFFISGNCNNGKVKKCAAPSTRQGDTTANNELNCAASYLYPEEDSTLETTVVFIFQCFVLSMAIKQMPQQWKTRFGHFSDRLSQHQYVRVIFRHRGDT